MSSCGVNIWPFLLASFVTHHFPVPAGRDVAADPRIDLCPGGICCAERTVPVDGICLPEQQNLTQGCWITAQCKAEGSVCRDPAGRYIYTVPNKQWEAYKLGNRTDGLVPGKCECRAALVMQTVPQTNGTRLICSERKIGSTCRSHYECGQRVRFSDCKHSRCVCSRPHYAYERATDLCIPAGTKIASKKTPSSDDPHLLLPATLGHQSFLTFFLCITVLFICACSTVAKGPKVSMDTRRKVYEKVKFEKVSAKDKDGEDKPPAYEQVVAEEVKLPLSEDQKQ